MMCVFFFNDTATTEIYTLSLHDALPISLQIVRRIVSHLNTVKQVDLDVAPPEPPAYDPEELYGIVPQDVRAPYEVREVIARDRKSTRLNSSHANISYAVFCLNKKIKDEA